MLSNGVKKWNHRCTPIFKNQPLIIKAFICVYRNPSVVHKFKSTGIVE